MQSTDVKKPTGDWNPTAGSTDRAIVPNPACTGNSPLALAHTAINHAALRCWCRGTIRTKPKGPVCDDTFGQAVATPTDKRGFAMPKLWGLVRLHLSRMVYGHGGGYPQGRPHGLSRVINHHAHPLRVMTQRVVLKSRQGATMPQAISAAVRTPTPFDPVATHMEAVNAAAMARWYAARYEHTKAARKATQALSALRKLIQFERAEKATTSASPCAGCIQNFALPDGPLDFFDAQVVRGYIELRTACTERAGAAKPCLKGGA